MESEEVSSGVLQDKTTENDSIHTDLHMAQHSGLSSACQSWRLHHRFDLDGGCVGNNKPTVVHTLPPPFSENPMS